MCLAWRTGLEGTVVEARLARLLQPRCGATASCLKDSRITTIYDTAGISEESPNTLPQRGQAHIVFLPYARLHHSVGGVSGL